MKESDKLFNDYKLKAKQIVLNYKKQLFQNTSFGTDRKPEAEDIHFFGSLIPFFCADIDSLTNHYHSALANNPGLTAKIQKVYDESVSEFNGLLK